MRQTIRYVVRKLMGERLFSAFLGLYWSLKLSVDRYEPETEALKFLVPKGGICLDVGGGFGQFCSFLSRAVGPTGRVHSFEPLPYNVDIFRRVIRYRRLNNVELHPFALGSRPGPALLETPAYESARTHISYEPGGLSVRVLTLDDWAEQAGISRVDFIKVDVEGFEFFVIQGARRVLSSLRPAVMCEIIDPQAQHTVSDRDVFRLLTDLGYCPFVWEQGRFVPAEEPQPHRSNYFFLHRSGGQPNSARDRA